MQGDVRIPSSVQHNVGSVEKLDGGTFFGVSITASQTLQVSLTVHGAVNHNQPVLGARGSSAEEGKQRRWTVPQVHPYKHARCGVFRQSALRTRNSCSHVI